MPNVFGRPNGGPLHHKVAVLEPGSRPSGPATGTVKPEHVFLAENMREDGRVKKPREDEFDPGWPGPKRSPRAAYEAFEKRYQAQVAVTARRRPEFLSDKLNQDNISSRPHSWSMEYRNLLNLSRPVSHMPEVMQGMPDNTPAPRPTAGGIGGPRLGPQYFTEWWDQIFAKPDGRHRLRLVFEHILTEISLSSEPPRHPIWLTPLVADPGTRSIEAELAQLGMFADDAWWVELRFEGRDFWDVDPTLAAPAY